MILGDLIWKTQVTISQAFTGDIRFIQYDIINVNIAFIIDPYIVTLRRNDPPYEDLVLP